MHNKFKRFIIFFILVLLFFGARSVFALEITYPPLPMVGTPENCLPKECLGQLVSYWFTFGIYIAGILALISFTIGAIGLINPNPESHNDAKDRMKNSVLGLVLVLSAFILLQTINPKFIEPTLTPLPGVAGIFYAKGTELAPTPMSESNVPGSAAIAEGYNQIFYKCTGDESGKGSGTEPALLIWKFPKPNYKGTDANYSGVTVARKNCGEKEPISGTGSFRMAWEDSGVYYFLNEGCSGYMSDANTSSQNKIADSFVGKIKSVKIVNDPRNNNYYGVIFHSDPDPTKGSDCTLPVYSFQDGCHNVADLSLLPNFSAYSADIFNFGKELSSPSANGVWLYGNVNGWDSGNKSGVAYINSDDIKKNAGQNQLAEEFVFDYTWVDSDLAITCNYFPSCREVDWETYEYPECCDCASPKDWNKTSTIQNENGCGGSIRFGGYEYLVSLYTYYTDKEGNKKIYCQSFQEDAPNLSSGSNFLPQEKNELDYINIIPIH